MPSSSLMKPPVPKRPPNFALISKEELRQRAASLDKIVKPNPREKNLRIDAISTMRNAKTLPPRPPRPEEIKE